MGRDGSTAGFLGGLSNMKPSPRGGGGGGCAAPGGGGGGGGGRGGGGGGGGGPLKGCVWLSVVDKRGGGGLFVLVQE